MSASLNISFIPLSSADPFVAYITDWYSTEINENERCKIFISGANTKLRVSSFCENLLTINGLA